MTAEDVCGDTYDIKLDKWTGRNRTRACVINRLNSGVWRETEDANIGFTTKKIARNAQVSVLKGDTMLHNNVSFVRQEFTLYSEGVYKWLYTKLTTHGNPWLLGVSVFILSVFIAHLRSLILSSGFHVKNCWCW